MQKAVTMHQHRHTAAVMESEQTAVTSAFMQTGLVHVGNQIVPTLLCHPVLHLRNDHVEV